METLKIEWVKSPTKILGPYVSYDEMADNNFNWNQKIQKMQSNLDVWKARVLTP